MGAMAGALNPAGIEASSRLEWESQKRSGTIGHWRLLDGSGH
jgi:hypothetical protein